MNIDKKIFKSIFGKEYNGEEKDMWAMISAHYLLSTLGANDPERGYSYQLTEHGLFSLKCIGDIECKIFSEKQLSEKSIRAIKTLKQSYKLTQDHITRDSRDIIIDTASYHFIKTSLNETKSKGLTKQLFEGFMPHSDFDSAQVTWANIESLSTATKESEVIA